MKKITCKDLGGPCGEEITGNSFSEVGNKCRIHVMEQMQKGDAAHLTAAASMQHASPEQQRAMMAEYEKKYNEAPHIS